MKIQVLQPNIEWESAQANLDRFEKMLCKEVGVMASAQNELCRPEKPAGRGDNLSQAAGTDLIVLPEMFATGFGADLGSAFADSGQIVSWMSRMAAKLNAAIVGSVAISENSTLKNRLLFVRPSGEVTTYDKRHLFSYSGENVAYSAGNERVVVEWRGVRFLLQVCYDLRFPVFSRNRNDYDVAIYVASWPEARVDVWDLLLRARAIENVCYVVGCNRVGIDPTAHYNGHSVILDYLGERVDDGGAAKKTAEASNATSINLRAEATPSETETLLTAEISTSNLVRFRRKFPVLTDADDFELLLG